MNDKKAIRRIAIANRGEIARRIIRTCRRLGIESVALYTPPDRDLPFVKEADLSCPLNTPTSYLSIEEICAAATATHADAIHPGYGFLSENPSFAAAVHKAGMIFIGPSAEAMERLGDKTKAKEIATGAAVPVAPTLLLSTLDPASAAEKAMAFGEAVGFPLMIKAAAGGGGRGMRLVTKESDITAELETAAREAERAFGRNEVFIEKCIAPARHIEVQIAADNRSTVIAIGTRDCTLQRNNQKLIEEAPAPNLTPKIRKDISDAAVRLSQAAGYSNLGTVEFLLTPDGTFYFLEVNCRLQVEHPVTEMTTGLDLVELQVALAAGATLADCGLTRTPECRGHAIEVRLNAETFDGQVAISTGRIEALHLPSALDPQKGSVSTEDQATLRFDMAIETASYITHHYDSLIGKVISHAPTRDEAISALQDALRQISISGVATNRGLQIELLSHPRFGSATHSVRETVEMFPSEERRLEEALSAHMICAALRLALSIDLESSEEHLENSASPWHTLAGWSMGGTLRFPFNTLVHGFEIASLASRQGDTVHVSVVKSPSASLMEKSFSLSEIASSVSLHRIGGAYWLHCSAGTWKIETHAPPRKQLGNSAAQGSVITSPLPGTITKLSSTVGDTVQADTTILMLDSMKMEHPIKAGTSGKVRAILVSEGSTVSAGAPLVEIEAGS